MQFSLQSALLLEKINALSRVIIPNPIVPILDNFLFEIKGNRLELTASDLQTTVVTHVAVVADEDATIAVPARILMETLKNLPNQTLHFVINFQSYNMTIQSATGTYQLACENPTDFPKLPAKRAEALQINLPAATLRAALEQVLFCTSKNDLHVALGGVHMEISPKQTAFIATDGHRLVRYIRKDIKAAKEERVTLPGKPLEHLTKLLSGKKEECFFSVQSDSAFFSFGDLALTTRLISESYPNYQNVIPNGNPYRLEVDQSELINALRIMLVYANRTTHQIRFKPSAKILHIFAEDLDFSNQAEEKLACTYQGDKLEIGFNVKLLSEMLQKISTKKISFSLDKSHKAVLVFPDVQESDAELLLLIMPVLLKHS